MKKPPSERLFVVDTGLAQKLDEWIACKAERVRLWLEIKAYIDEHGLTRESVRGMLAEKGIREGGGKPPLFDVKPRKRARKLFGISEEEYRVERDMIFAAKWAILRGIPPEDFVVTAHKAFEIVRNLQP
jgi:hypothetical protein